MSDTPEIADNGPGGVVARIIAAHGRQAAEARDRSGLLSAAWERALRHAAVPFKGLELSPDTTEVSEHSGRAPALGMLPETGLIAVLEDRDGARGLIALSHGALDALVEVQTTGRVDTRELPPRPVTRIDEALSRDFIDLSLAAFSRETETLEDRDWPLRMSFGSRIADRGQLTLLLPDRVYHVMSASVRLGEEGARNGTAVLVLPRTREPRPRALLREGAAAPEAWRAALEAAMAEARLGLDAVLVRTTRSLQEVEAIAPGDLIGFDPSDLAAVRLETPEGRTVLRGRLGQIGGQRALRMSGGAARPGPPMAAGAIGVQTLQPDAPQDLPHAHDTPTDGLPDRMGLPPAALPSVADTSGTANSDPAQDPAAQADVPAPAPLDFAPRTVPLDPGALPD
jgi:flagellar motor switch protein FliM